MSAAKKLDSFDSLDELTKQFKEIVKSSNETKNEIDETFKNINELLAERKILQNKLENINEDPVSNCHDEYLKKVAEIEKKYDARRAALRAESEKRIENLVRLREEGDKRLERLLNPNITAEEMQQLRMEQRKDILSLFSDEKRKEIEENFLLHNAEAPLDKKQFN